MPDFKLFTKQNFTYAFRDASQIPLKSEEGSPYLRQVMKMYHLS